MAEALLLPVPVAETGPVTERLRVREIDDEEGRQLVRIVRRGSGSVVTWRRAQMVLLPAQGMDVAPIARVAFTSEDRVRDAVTPRTCTWPVLTSRSTRARQHAVSAKRPPYAALPARPSSSGAGGREYAPAP